MRSLLKASDGIRTRALFLTKEALHQAELRRHLMERNGREGIKSFFDGSPAKSFYTVWTAITAKESEGSYGYPEVLHRNLLAPAGLGGFCRHRLCPREVRPDAGRGPEGGGGGK